MTAERLTDARIAELIEAHVPCEDKRCVHQRPFCLVCGKWWPCEIASLAVEAQESRAKAKWLAVEKPRHALEIGDD